MRQTKAKQFRRLARDIHATIEENKRAPEGTYLQHNLNHNYVCHPTTVRGVLLRIKKEVLRG